MVDVGAEEDEEGEDGEECAPKPDSRSPAAPHAAKRAKRPPFETTIGGAARIILKLFQAHASSSFAQARQ